MSTCLLLSSHFETLYCIGFGNSSEPRRFWLNISDLLDVCDEQYVMILTYGCAAVTLTQLCELYLLVDLDASNQIDSVQCQRATCRCTSQLGTNY